MNTRSSRTNADPKFDSHEQEAFLNLWRCYDCLKAFEEAAFAQFGLSPQQYNALRLLEALHPERMQSVALGRKLISRGPDTTRLLDRLESNGWIIRSRSQSNRRIVEVSITRSGLELLQTMHPTVLAMHQEQLGHLSDHQRRELIRLLRLARGPHDDGSCPWLDQ
jgi:DNA-binding MarR family transcriptional regulator